jgi:hypothetical protein
VVEVLVHSTFLQEHGQVRLAVITTRTHVLSCSARVGSASLDLGRCQMRISMLLCSLGWIKERGGERRSSGLGPQTMEKENHKLPAFFLLRSHWLPTAHGITLHETTNWEPCDRTRAWKQSKTHAADLYLVPRAAAPSHPVSINSGYTACSAGWANPGQDGTQ